MSMTPHICDQLGTENACKILLSVLQLSGRQMRPIKWSGDPDITKYWSDWQPKNMRCQSPGLIVPDDAVIFFFHFYVGQPKICVDQLGGPLDDPGFFIRPRIFH